MVETESVIPRETCLVVDDEPPVRAFMRAILERKQFQVIEAENGAQAAGMVQKLGDAIDLIVTDIRMPGGDGITLACSVRDSFPLLPIILVSGYAEPPWKRYPSAAFVFVPKPFLPATLLAAVARAKDMMAMKRKALSSD
jgi:CheY-like chemotaxis protein